MSSDLRLLPWCDWQEWYTVRSLLYSEDPAARVQGVSWVTVWRCREKIPHAVESTAQLTEVSLCDSMSYQEQADGGGGSGGWEVTGWRRSETELRLNYSTALLRCVNGLVEPSQKGNFASSVQSLAQSVGLPSWIVDLRHEATHKDLPSLCTLRLAASYLLEYLSQRYWGVQAEHLEFLRDAFKQLLGNYRAVSERDPSLACNVKTQETAKSSSTSTPNPAGSAAECVTDILKSLTSTALAWAVVPLLAGDGVGVCGILIPTSSSKYPVGGEDTTALLFCRWEPLLSALQARWGGFASALLVRLVEALLTEDNSEGTPEEKERRRYFLSCWVRHVMVGDWARQKGSAGRKEARAGQARGEVTNDDPAPFPISALLKRCAAAAPSLGAAAAGIELAPFATNGRLEETDDDEEVDDASEGGDSSMQEGTGECSLEDIEAIVDMDDEEQNENESIESVPVSWSRCDRWESCPIGMMPGRSSVGLEPFG